MPPDKKHECLISSTQSSGHMPFKHILLNSDVKGFRVNTSKVKEMMDDVTKKKGQTHKSKEEPQKDMTQESVALAPPTTCGLLRACEHERKINHKWNRK